LTWLDVACRVVARIGVALFGVTWVIGWIGIACLLVATLGVALLGLAWLGLPRLVLA
jgi:hypothetical protein